jgi:glycerol-3-phosphate O-acyltransferase/dihydroxyacetone phosphate acyltransferase
LIGGFCKAIGSIPVARPQDNASTGPGKICFEGLTMKGVDTLFSTIPKADRLRPGRSTTSYKIKKVISDTEAELAEESGEPSARVEETCQGAGKWSTYDLLAYVDQGDVFGAVQAALADGQCLGIFPEGGSHDRTDLLPLKAGIAAIAFGVKEKYNVSVPIVPVGLNYFRGHRFRGRVVVEFGEPMYITKEQTTVYHEVSKREAYQDLLSDIEKGMRSVIVTAPKYSELKLVHTARRLYYQNKSRGTAVSTTTTVKQDLARRYARRVYSFVCFLALLWLLYWGLSLFSPLMTSLYIS